MMCDNGIYQPRAIIEPGILSKYEMEKIALEWLRTEEGHEFIYKLFQTVIKKLFEEKPYLQNLDDE